MVFFNVVALVTSLIVAAAGTPVQQTGNADARAAYSVDCWPAGLVRTFCEGSEPNADYLKTVGNIVLAPKQRSRVACNYGSSIWVVNQQINTVTVTGPQVVDGYNAIKNFCNGGQCDRATGSIGGIALNENDITQVIVGDASWFGESC